MMFYYMVVLVILFLLNFLLFPQLLKPDVKEVDYGTFLSMVDKKEVSKVQIEDDMIYFQDKEETPNYYETAAFEDPDLVERLYDAGCSFDRVVQKEMSPLLSFLLTWILPILIFAGLGELLGRSMMKRMSLTRRCSVRDVLTAGFRWNFRILRAERRSSVFMRRK